MRWCPESKVDEAKLTNPVLRLLPWMHLLYGDWHYCGGELLSFRLELATFGVQHLLFACATSRCRPWWFFHFSKIYSELYQQWSTRHTGLVFVDERPVWWPEAWEEKTAEKRKIAIQFPHPPNLSCDRPKIMLVVQIWRPQNLCFRVDCPLLHGAVGS